MSPLYLVFFLAARNVLRYRKRTLQTFLILCCGTFCIILIDAYMRGFAASSAERVVSQCGHIDVHAAGYLDSSEAMPLDLSIPDAEAVMARLLESAAGSTSPNVRPLVAPSVVIGCMLSNGEVSRGALVLATEPWARTLPGQAAMLNPLLSDAAESIVSGSFFHDPSERGAIVDEKYASRLGIGVAEPLILLGNDSYGSFSMVEVPVIGLAREASLPGEAGCVVDFASFTPAFGLEGTASAISLWFAAASGAELSESRAESAAVRAVLEAFATDKGLEIRPFAIITASYAAMLKFLDIFLAGMMAIFAMVACVGIINAILLSVQDRIRDLGTLRAIAFTSRQACLMVYAETLITGLAAAVAALALGTAAVWILSAAGTGISFEFSEASSVVPKSIRPDLFPLRLLAIAGLSAVFPLLAAILPARTARKLTIKESLEG